VLLTTGEQSPPIFAPVVSKIAAALLDAERHTFSGAGHVPHVTHPDDYIEVTCRFIGKHAS
jgi:pimeloyl-ACP methyl ester carboxylesterase